ncbi:MAG: transcriptional regulator, LuxR family [Frankiales bacterium]|nr:transcriptional regulator, LuxR family [Frankiales bacterium]
MTFEEFVLARGPALVRFATGLCGDRHLAEDLVQDVLARCHPRWARLADAPEPYVRQALVRALVSWRRRRSSTELPGDLPDRAAPEGSDDVDARDAVWRLLADLSARERAVLVLRHYEALPDQEIAGLLGCSRATVRSLAMRAGQKLRALPDLAHLPDPADDDARGART